MQRIVSGGQTGVDRAALDVAIELRLTHGGWCPRGRRAEDGPIPERYELQETDSPEYAVRTEQNVLDSDATLIVATRPLTGGTSLTERFARQHGKPLMVCDPDLADVGPIVAWLKEHNVRTLNVAGPRESTCPGIGEKTAELLRLVLAEGDDGTLPGADVPA